MTSRALPQVIPFRGKWAIVYISGKDVQQHIKFFPNSPQLFRQAELRENLERMFNPEFVANVEKMSVQPIFTPLFDTAEIATAAMEYVEAFVLAWQMEENAR